MKQIFSKPLVWISLIILFIIIFFLALVTRVDYSEDIPIEKKIPYTAAFNLFRHLKISDHNNLRDSFPYEIYLDSANLNDVLSISLDLAIMDTFNPGHEMLNQEVLSIALTEKLENRIKSKLQEYNPDSLIRILQWAEKFNAYAEIDPARATLFGVIYNHWLNYISNTLQEYYEKDDAIKYNYKFRYILNRCKEKQFSTSIKGTYPEKVIDNLLQKKWSYLFNKFWHATSISYKAMVSLLLIVIIFPYIYIFKILNNKS